MTAKDQAIIRAARQWGRPSREVRDYEKEIASREKKVTPRRWFASAPKPQSPGKLVSVQAETHGATLIMERAAFKMTFLTPDILHFRARPDKQFPPLMSYAVLPQAAGEFEVTVTETDTGVTLSTNLLTCQVTRDGRLSLHMEEATLLETPADSITWTGEAVRWTRTLPKEESGYGLGQRAFALGLRGREYQLQNLDPALYMRDEDPCYFSVPLYVGVQESYTLGIFWDNPAVGRVDVGKTRADVLTFEAVKGDVNLYFIAAAIPQALYERYTLLTGRPYMPPLWALGYHQSRYSYENEARFRAIAQEFRQRRIPCDVLHYDIDYMDEYRCFTCNNTAFSNLAGLVRELSEQGFKSVSIIDPGIKADKAWQIYQSGKARDVFLKYPDGAAYTGIVWPGLCEFPDFSKPDTRRWWAEQVAAFVTESGMAGVWNDMNEPTVFLSAKPGTFPGYLPYHWEGQGQTHDGGGNNTYGMLMAQATREGLEKAYPDRRPFTFTRAGYAGVQRYASSWTGDNLSTWDHLKLTISMVVNQGLSGIPFTGPDVGGFGGDSEGELYTRWIQLGAMMPFFRTHTAKDTQPQEPWSYGAQYESIIRRYIELRYQLLPYFYSVMAEAYQHGLPFVRPGFFFDLSDPNLRYQEDAFAVGDSLFVAPILEKGVTQRKVYLPRGAWYEYWSGKLIDGAREITVTAGLETLPMFVRAGKVLPQWPTQQYVGEQKIEEITFRVYAGLGETALYEDAGEGLGYQSGDYRFSYLTCKVTGPGQFGVDWRTAGAYKPGYQRVRVEVVGIPGEPEQITVDNRPAPLWFFENGVLEIVTPPFKEIRLIGRRTQDDDLSGKTLMRRPRL